MLIFCAKIALDAVICIVCYMFFFGNGVMTTQKRLILSFSFADLALKSARIVDLCGESSGFTDFESIVDRGSAVSFYADSGLCLSHVRTSGPKRILDHRSFFSLDRNVNKFIQIISFFVRSSFKLRCETIKLLELYFVVIKHVAFFTIWTKLTCAVAFACTSLPSSLFSSVFGCGCGFGFGQKFWWIGGFGEKRHGSADLRTPIHSPSSIGNSFHSPPPPFFLPSRS